MTKQEIMNEEARLRARYGKLVDELAAVMYRHDTEGLAAFGCPQDEYMPEVRRVLQQLEMVTNALEMRQLVTKVFAEMFDEALDATNEQLCALADEVWTQVRANRR